MRPSAIAALALLAALLACRPATPPAGSPAPALSRAGLDTLVGRTWPGDATPIAGTSAETAWLVATPNDSGPGFALTVFPVNGRRLLLFNQETGRSGPHAVWRILDAVWLPALGSGQRLVSVCRYGDRRDGAVFAIANYTDTEWLRDIRAAWRANVATARIEPAPTADLSCEHVGWGAD